jgi:iron complex outermembrane receptor protein
LQHRPYPADGACSLHGEVVAFERRDRVSVYTGEQATSGYDAVNAGFSWSASPRVRFDMEASNPFDRGHQDHLAGVNRVTGVDIPPGEGLWGAERTITLGAVVTF